MRYKVGNLEIRSENAAKPQSQTSSHLIGFFKNLPHVRNALDYGCGKLRYSKHLLSLADSLTVVDSEVQLGRTQKIGGSTTTIRKYVARYWKRCRALNVEEFRKDTTAFDFILCANVLSTIPIVSERRKVLSTLFSALASNGRCLFVAQYRNSYFKKVMQSDAATNHLDGWILQSLRGPSFYGLITLDALKEMATRVNLEILEAWVHEGSAYVLCTKR